MKYTKEEKKLLKLGKKIGIYENENGEIEFDLERINELKNSDFGCILKHLVYFDKIEEFYMKIKGVPLNHDNIINKELIFDESFIDELTLAPPPLVKLKPKVSFEDYEN